MTTPDRLAAAVAQGHEDAVQAWPQEGRDRQRRIDSTPCPKCGGDRLRADFTGSGRCHAGTPAPVSYPAGEDVERVARVEARRRLDSRWTATPHPDLTNLPEGEGRAYIFGFERGVQFAALSARPVEAQEVESKRPDHNLMAERDAALARAEEDQIRAERAESELARCVLSRAELADEVQKLRDRVARTPDRLQRAEQQVADLRAEVERRGDVVREGAALVQAARAEAAEAVIEKVRAYAEQVESAGRVYGYGVAHDLRALLDTDSEGREV